MMQQFPDFHLEDKVSVWEGSNDTSQAGGSRFGQVYQSRGKNISLQDNFGYLCLVFIQSLSFLGGVDICSQFWSQIRFDFLVGQLDIINIVPWDLVDFGMKLIKTERYQEYPCDSNNRQGSQVTWDRITLSHGKNVILNNDKNRQEYVDLLIHHCFQTK